jgi:phosphohistidine phosphatase
MRLYLVQHGDALPKEADPERPLSERGQTDVRRVASFLRDAGIRVPRVLHSGKKRAEQTANALADTLGLDKAASSIAGIAPLDPTEPLAEQAAQWQQDTMVVGHLPFMAKLVSRLLIGDEAVVTAGFEPGTIVCLERSEGGGWSLVWAIRPSLLRGGG